jgi:type I restriction-modification system DNA methylase subunit
MPVLTTQQRSALENAVKQARRLAEAGARNALQHLATDQPEPYAHMSPEHRALRNRLRSKARLLGDALAENSRQQITHLAYELAYEYWHKMLFAKFLESNNLLMHTSGSAVTLDECAELAPDEGFADKWDAAASYASKMLPAIFRPEDPLMQVSYATEDRLSLERVLDGLDDHIFTADDALGWVYQFWQSDAKDAINKSGDKIDGEKLPAVTQLFTEPYMVHFLIDNTIGAWWVSRNKGVTPPVKWDYLRYTDDGKPAAGSFEGWPDTTAALTTLDPCMGSGHFVAALFNVLAPLRMQEEGLTKEEATDKVIAENLHGLELDARCTQIAAFNLALTAWKFCGDYKELPEMNLACSGIAPKGKKEDWVKLVGNVARDDKGRMENGMRMLYDHFQLAPELGSLLDPTTIKADAFTASFEQLQPVLIKALKSEKDNEEIERGVMAAGIAKAGEILSNRYTLIITNVPYLVRGKQDDKLCRFCEINYPEAKNDLATVFLERLSKTASLGGTFVSVIPQNWLFLTSYRKFREKMLRNTKWNLLVKLGAGAFSQISGEVVKAILIVLSKGNPSAKHVFTGIDVSEAKSVDNKELELKLVDIKTVIQEVQLKNPDTIISLDKIEQSNLLEQYADSIKGWDTGDDPEYTRLFWELPNLDSKKWLKYHSTPNGHDIFSGKERILLWENGNGKLVNNSGGNIRRKDTLTKTAIAVKLIGALEAGIFQESAFDTNISAIVPHNNDDFLPLWAFVSSPEFHKEIRKINQKMNASNAVLGKVSFDKAKWQKEADEKYPNGLPKPYSNDATQWLFHGHPVHADNPLQVAMARLLGYRWPAENDADMELADEARELIAAIQPFNSYTDDDGIMCRPPINGELQAAERLREYLKAVWGTQWSNDTLQQLLQKEGAKKTNLEDWLRDEYMEQHNKLFQNRPFIWHIWDGRKDGFSALVNYHLLTKDNLQKLIYTYLGDWIRQCIAKKNAGESGADGQLIAAEALKTKLEAILEGEAPCDTFVRWKPLDQQSIGWDPDLNDGVRLNIRPFITADILRKKPNIKWGVDRGKNPPGSPWGEIRDNDVHLSLEEKSKARG